MPAPAREISLMFRPGDLPAATEGFAQTLAGHLVGYRLETGQRLALPGWPTMTVAEVVPAGGRVQPGTEIEITLPPRLAEGPVDLAILVDASLTMGEGAPPTAYDRAAPLIDAILMNGRSFLGSAGLVLQGGETRYVEEAKSPESLSGALIHRVTPRGTFDLQAGLEEAMALLDEASHGPRAVLVVSDGDVPVVDPMATAVSIARRGASLFAVTETPNQTLSEACAHTGGLADEDPDRVFEALAELAGARADWTPPQPPDPEAEPEFEVVIETMEDPT